jgi:hypothetical protein
MSSENPGSLVVVKNFIPVREKSKIDYSRSFDYNQSMTKTRENDLKNKQLKKKSKN